MRYVRPYISKYGKLFSLAIVCLAIEATADLLLPTIMASIIDDGVVNHDMEKVLRLGGWMLLVTAVGAGTALVRNFISSRVSQRFGADLRADLFRHIQSLTFASLDKFERPSLMTRLTNDVTQVQNFVNGLMRIFVKAPMICVGSLIMAVNLNPRLSVALLVVVPIVAALIYLNMRIGFPLFASVQRALDRINGTTREYLSGVRVVKAFNRYEREMEKFDAANDDYRVRSTLAARVLAVFSPGVMLTVNIGIAAIIWIGGNRVHAGQMQVGHILAFIHYMTQILHALLMISHVFTMFVRAKASAERIGEVFAENGAAEREQARASADAANADHARDIDSRQLTPVKIAFDRVSFTYAGAAEPSLRNISFECRAGETVGLIGATGSGKSTLVSLIPRFYDVTEGAIRIDGRDVREWDTGRLREQIAIVPQQSVLFTGTIAHNIRWGKEDATPEQMARAARIAQAESFIMALPEQYESRLGQGGVNLSGGQKQRLSIARALVREPDILILDDSTSAVDTATETRIKEALRAYAANITCLIIAQRITSVIDADKIIVLENGEMAGVGTHDELLATCRTYQEIYRSQIGKEASEHVKSAN